MIDNAQKHSDKLKKLFLDTWYNDRYKFFEVGPYSDTFSLPDSNWSEVQFVSLDKSGEVIGYIGFTIDRPAYYVNSLSLINFRFDDHESTKIFGMDVIHVIKDIFTKWNFNKLVFRVIIGNPIELKYDRLVKKVGGRIVGTYTNHVRLNDNGLYDIKSYEISRDQYLLYKNRGSLVERESHYLIMSRRIEGPMGCTVGEEGKSNVLSEDPDVIFVEVDKSECPICNESSD